MHSRILAAVAAAAAAVLALTGCSASAGSGSDPDPESLMAARQDLARTRYRRAIATRSRSSGARGSPLRRNA